MQTRMSKWCAALAMVLLAACSKDNGSSTSQTEAVSQVSSANEIRCLAGSELQDVASLLPQIEQQTGVKVTLIHSGTLTSVEKLEAGEKYDCGWFSHNKYLMLNDRIKSQVRVSERIMASPVVLGVSAQKAASLGWDKSAPTWAEIAKAASDGKFTFAMTSPASSNTGMSALVGVTAALSGTDRALDAKAIEKVELSGFGKGHVLFSDSSGWLSSAYVESAVKGKAPDGLVNYESELLRINAEGKLPKPLVLVYPKEGVITADYPLMLFNSEKRALFDKVVTHLKGDATQRWLMDNTFRRPVSMTVPLDEKRFGDQLLVDLPFPAHMSVLDALLTSYIEKQRKPGHVYFVLDTSGSMNGQGMNQLQGALAALAGEDASVTGRYAKFRQREKVTVVEFSDKVKSVTTFDMGDKPELKVQALTDFRQYASNLRPDGGTAMFDGVRRAYEQAVEDAAKEPGYVRTIVVMTDGESNEGMRADGFSQWYSALPAQQQGIRVFGVLFGDASARQVNTVATLTGGTVFGTDSSLAAVFKKIRGYQ